MSRRILLDTHYVVWFLANDARLTDAHRTLLLSTTTDVLVSDISLYEIVIKQAIGKLGLTATLPQVLTLLFQTAGFGRLPLRDAHLMGYLALPFPANGHRDPFDRMLVAQAISEGAALLSADEKLTGYADVAVVR